MMKLFGQQSFFDVKKKKIESALKLPLLELVLQFLPHLQPSLKEKEDVWEVVAIKLNDHQFLQAFEERDVEKDHTEQQGDQGFSLDEIPTLNGTFARELFEKFMDKFVKAIHFHNMNHNIHCANTISGGGGNNGVQFKTFNLPVYESYSTDEDRICCKLYYMRGLAVELKANAAREMLTQKFAAGPADPEKHSVHSVDIKQVQESSDKLRVQVLLEDLEKKVKRLDTLDKENKRLMQMNRDLLDEMNLSRKEAS